MPDVTYSEKPFDPDGFWRNKGARDLRPPELAVLRELYLWRDKQARTMNRPPFKILSDQELVRLAQTQPREVDDLEVSAWQARRLGQGILAAIDKGRRAPHPQFPARSKEYDGRPDRRILARYDRLREWRAQRAAERGVEGDIVFSNGTLMAIARAEPSTLAELADAGALGPWKLEEYGTDLLRVLNENTPPSREPAD